MSIARYAVYFIDPSVNEYVFHSSGPNRETMQSQADAINRNMPRMKAIVLTSHSPNDRIDPYHQDFARKSHLEKAFA